MYGIMPTYTYIIKVKITQTVMMAFYDQFPFRLARGLASLLTLEITPLAPSFLKHSSSLALYWSRWFPMTPVDPLEMHRMLSWQNQ